MQLLNKEHNDLCVGIDLGTTNSALATINIKPNGDIVSKIIDLPRAVDIYSSLSNKTMLSTAKKPLLPSCVYYREEQDYAAIVGDFAKAQYPLRPLVVAKSIKSQMGNSKAENLSPNIPDHTPAQISARILQHMLRQTEMIYGTAIDDAIITVPANFDSIMCKATRDAAALAGIKTTNDDGNERPLLLSEPNAVIYDLINQLHNGEIPHQLIDLDEPKNVLVFDLGGGTLDITMHTIRKRKEAPNILKVDEIATNRYTLLGGDNFDEAIAAKMYERYLKQYAAYPEVVSKLKLQKNAIMPQLLMYAEMVKLELSSDNSGTCFAWKSDGTYDVGGNINASGYAYDDNFTKLELENILAPFMGYEYKFADYQNLADKTDTQNIIYPILDVLDKASKKLEQTPQIDYVIVNGGMSKFYLIINRLTEFFGKEPIRVLDPDQAVARGAAIYHHYLHQYEQLQDDMRLLGDAELLKSYAAMESQEEYQKRLQEIAERRRQAEEKAGIEWGNKILNDAIYLGVRFGDNITLAAAGTALPAQLKPLKGFQLMPRTQSISLPIKIRTINGAMHIIAGCKVILPFNNENGCYISLTGSLSEDKTLKILCTASKDAAGKNKLADCTATINVDQQQNFKSKNFKTKILLPSGSVLQALNEVNFLEQLYSNLFMKEDPTYAARVQPKLNYMVNNLKNAKNKNEIIAFLMKKIKKQNLFYQQHALLVVLYEFINDMNILDKSELAVICRNLLGTNDNKSEKAVIRRNITVLKCLRRIGNSNDLSLITSYAYRSEYQSVFN